MGWPSRILLGLLCAYAATALTTAAARTVYVQQDAAYYCEVAERFSQGQGLTSLCDRRGPADPGAFPQSYRGSTAWPLLLGLMTAVTGDPEITGTAVSIVALLGSLVLGSLCLNRRLGVPGIPAALCVGAAVLHRESVGSAILPLTDSLSLFLTVAALHACMGGRPGWGTGLVALAIAVRYQNAALLLPLLWAWSPAKQLWAAIIAGAVVSALVLGGRAFEGLLVLVDPTHRDSLWRGLRYLGVPLLIGGFFYRRERRLAPIWCLFLGHLLILLCVPDPSASRPWLFAQRHALPLHFAAAAVAGVTLTRSGGTVYWLALLSVLIAFTESSRRPAKALQSQEEITARPDLAMAESWLRRHPLPAGAVVLSQDADVLSRRLGLQAVHLRGFEPDPCVPFLEHLPTRSITHVLLAWQHKPVMKADVRRLEEFARCLRPHADVVAEQEDIGHRSRFVLFRLDR